MSLCDGGWISAADPNDQLVSIFIEELTELANHFGEGAVLEREGQWTKERTSSNGPVNPFDRVALEELTGGILEDGPMATLSRATSIMAGVEPHVDGLLETLSCADWAEAQALGCALEWLSYGKLNYAWNDVPQWLVQLDRAEITSARRCRGDDGDAYLVSMEADGCDLGIASYFVKHEGHIDSFFAIPDSMATYTQLLKTLQRGQYKPFRKIAVSTARRSLDRARDVPVDPNDIVAGLAWPGNRPLLNLIVDHLNWQNGQQTPQGLTSVEDNSN